MKSTLTNLRFAIVFILSTFVASSCAITEPPGNRFCSTREFLIDANFEGGNFHSCSTSGEYSADIEIRPEDKPPINESPWYAFRVSPRDATSVEIKITFLDGYARYWPKTSNDKIHWTPVDEAVVNISEDGRSMVIRLDLDEQLLYVSGQELVTTDYYYAWIRELAARDDVKSQLLGHSVQGRPIFVAKTGTKPEAVLLIGRQHPPEITGALAMRSFVGTVLGDTDLAGAFRERYSVIIIPLINPDGVALGYWRHNVNGVDLNRDWGPFTQPETRSVARLLESVEKMGMSLELMLDFHSTRTNTFYTQLPEESTTPVDFATVWLDRAKERLPDFEFKHDARAPSGQANTKNYFFNTYGIPAITFELGDETDRQAIHESTPVIAEEMMRAMLER